MLNARTLSASQWPLGLLTSSQHRTASQVVPPNGVASPAAARPRTVCQGASRDVSFAYQKDIQTKLKPGEFADRMDNKANHLAGAQDWSSVLALFNELGDNPDRSVGLVGDMLVSLQRLVPAGAAAGGLTPQESRALAVGIAGMCEVLLSNITRINNKLLVNIIWALALLPDPAKPLKAQAATTARARAVAAFGASLITRMGKMNADELFHVCAGLALLGFKPPRTLQREPKPQSKTPDAAQQAAPEAPQPPMKFGTMLERRSLKVIHYLTPKTLADAAFVMSRLVAPGDVSTEWMEGYAKTSKQHLSTMQPEALVYAGYALARHGFKPSNSWRKAYMAALQGIAKTLAGEEFPMVLFTLARWQQQQQLQLSGPSLDYDNEEDEEFDQQFGQQFDQQPGSSSSSSSAAGPVVPQGLIDDLLLASHTNRALRELPLGQLVVMVKALAQLQLPVNPMWMQRLWPLVNSKIDAALSSSSTGTSSSASSSSSTGSSSSSSAAGVSSLAADLAALLAALPKLNPSPTLPPDFVEGLVGNLGLGLKQLNPADMAAAFKAMKELRHKPDAIFMRQLQQAVLQAVPRTASKDLTVLVKLGVDIGHHLVYADDPISCTDQALEAAAAFYQQLQQALVQEVQQRMAVASGTIAPAAAARGAGQGSRLAAQQQQQAQVQQRAALLAGAAADGLWQLPQVLVGCLDYVWAYREDVKVMAKDSGRPDSYTPAWGEVLYKETLSQLGPLWKSAAVSLAGVMPTDQLLVLLGNVLDVPQRLADPLDLCNEEADATDTGLGWPSKRQRALIAAILEAGVYCHLDSTTGSAGSTSSAAAGTAAGSTGSTGSGPGKDLLRCFSVADFWELLIIIKDAGLDAAAPAALFDAAAEALHGALAAKGPAYGFGCSEEEAADLVRELLGKFSYTLPAKVKTRYKKWVEERHGQLPVELSQRRTSKKSSRSSSSSSSSSKKAAAASAAVEPVPAAAAAWGAAAPAGSIDVGGVVSSSRSRSPFS